MTPKVFISYSWSDQAHQQLVIQWAEQLMSDGVEVVLDVYDLKEGDDKYVFMEKMVTDQSVTHVLIICDKTYSEKADARKAGVGTESQIISKEVYEKVQQSKFIPLACEFGTDGHPYLPTFLKSRIWIDFSSEEKVNENWGKLIRLLFGKPFHKKPTLGKAPSYISEDSDIPSDPAVAKYNALRQAILQEKKGLRLYRKDFLDACYEYADSFRVKAPFHLDGDFGMKVLDDCKTLIRVRDHIVDWVLLESSAIPSNDFDEALSWWFEQMLELKSRPKTLEQSHEEWFEAHRIWAYEVLLYIIAALLKTQSYASLAKLFSSHYLLPETERYDGRQFARFDDFYTGSQMLGHLLAPEGKRLLSPVAELLKRHAQRTDLPFKEILQADLLTLLIAFITPEINWFPQTLYYAGRFDHFDLFLRASQHKHFENLAKVTGIDNADVLRDAIKKGHERLRVDQWYEFRFDKNFWKAMNMDKLDSIK